MKLFIVEDEPPARELLRTMAARRSELDVIGEASDGLTALDGIRTLVPDVVLMDIEIPEMDGFAVLSRLLMDGVEPPHIVFVTAFDCYAVRAFDVHAMDYILKPVTHERFDRAIDRCLDVGPGDGASMHELLEDAMHLPPTRLLVRERERIVLVPVTDIDWIEADRDYVRIHCGKKSYLIEKTLSAMERMLEPKGFARIHRSSLVNLDRVLELRPEGSGRYRMRLKDGTELTLSRSHSARFRAGSI